MSWWLFCRAYSFRWPFITFSIYTMQQFPICVSYKFSTNDSYRTFELLSVYHKFYHDKLFYFLVTLLPVFRITSNIIDNSVNINCSHNSVVFLSISTFEYLLFSSSISFNCSSNKWDISPLQVFEARKITNVHIKVFTSFHGSYKWAIFLFSDTSMPATSLNENLAFTFHSLKHLASS